MSDGASIRILSFSGVESQGCDVFMIPAKVLLAYFEEGIWDIFIWKDHPDVFPLLTAQSPITHPIIVSMLVAILVLPQVTHYVLDGFIWRFSRDTNARPD